MTAIIACAVLTACGCAEDVRFGGRAVRKVEVRPVTHYGLSLDASASPQQVAFVALQAVRDDFRATTEKDRQAALDVQFDLAAANVIAARKPKRSSAENDEFLHDVVYHWTPTVSYYVGDFPKTLKEAESRLMVRSSTDSDVELAMETADPSGDPKSQVVMLIWLAKDKGMWRVLHFGFDRKRSLADTRAGAPGGQD